MVPRLGQGISYYTRLDVELMCFEHSISMKEFDYWMHGQGCPIIEGGLCYFSWDVQRFFEHKGVKIEKTRNVDGDLYEL